MVIEKCSCVDQNTAVSSDEQIELFQIFVSLICIVFFLFSDILAITIVITIVTVTVTVIPCQNE